MSCVMTKDSSACAVCLLQHFIMMALRCKTHFTKHSILKCCVFCFVAVFCEMMLMCFSRAVVLCTSGPSYFIKHVSTLNFIL